MNLALLMALGMGMMGKSGSGRITFLHQGPVPCYYNGHQILDPCPSPTVHLDSVGTSTYTFPPKSICVGDCPSPYDNPKDVIRRCLDVSQPCPEAHETGPLSGTPMCILRGEEVPCDEAWMRATWIAKSMQITGVEHYHQAEPMDVPAVQVGTVMDCGFYGAELDCRIFSCADNHRILEHDSQSPPSWWCRKVQP